MGDITEKLCRSCAEVKPAKDFPRNGRNQDGLHSYCRTCVAIAGRISRTSRPPTDPLVVESDLDLADQALAGIRLNRRYWRRRSNPAAGDRRASLQESLEQIDSAMKPLRSHIGRLAWEPVPEKLERRLRKTSQELQYERKQIKKMMRPTL